MRFNYLEANSIEEAVSLLTKYDGKAKAIAGGTDLLVKIRDKVIKPEYIIDIVPIPGLNYIKSAGKKGIAIGTLTSIRELEKSPELQKNFPIISQAAGQLGSVAIRNMATVGGNLCNAAPSAEMAPALIGLSATVKIVGSDGERVAPLEDFFTGPGTTILKTGELLVEIQVPPVPPNTTGVYLKHGIRGSIDLAIVGVAAVVTLEPKDGVCKDVKIVLGAVAPTPMRAHEAEQVLKGKQITDALIERCAEVASNESRPITDVRASDWYRKEMVKVFTRQAIKEAMAKEG